MNLPKKKVLVLGGAGYIGSACVSKLVQLGYSVFVFDNLSTGQRDKVDKNATFIEGSILNYDALEGVFTNYGSMDVVFHFAALKAAGESELYPEKYFETNISGTINILSAMKRHSVPKIIFSSTAAVYSPTELGVYSESDCLGSINVYGASKLIAEKIITEFTRTKQIQRYAILRYFNVAGDSGLRFKEKRAQNIFPILAHALKNEEKFTVFGTDYPTRDGTCIRDYIHINDLVDAHIKAIEIEDSFTVNLGTKQGTSVLELIKTFEQYSKKKLNIVLSGRRPGDPAVVVADPSLSKNIIGWVPKHGINDMVESMLDAYKT